MSISERIFEYNTVVDLMQARARNTPDRLAVNVAGRPVSCAQLAELAEQCAGGLAALGVVKGDRVASMLFNSIEQIVVWFAAARIGAIWVPLNVGLLGDDLAYTLTDAAPKVLVCDTEAAAKIAAVKAQVQAKGQGQVSARHFIVGEVVPEGFAPFSALLSTAVLAPVALARKDPAVIVYTGGTTGMPKGVVLPHFAWIAAAYRYVDAFDIRPDDCHYSVLPLFHVAGSMIGFLGPYLAGIPSHFDRWFSVSNFWERARETGATIIDPIGTMVTLLCQAPANESDRDHRVRVSLAVLSQVPQQIANHYPLRFGVDLVNVYSLSESGGTLIVHNKADSPKIQSNGKPWGWCELRIGADDDHSLPPNQIGEILLRPTLPDTFMIGYYNNPERTLECFRNLWLHTGDLGYVDEEGYLFFTGRHAHWLRCRGENVSAYEVEDIMSRYPNIREVVVVGVPAPLGEEDIKAFIIAETSVKLDPADIIMWCKEHMANFKLPRYIVFCDEFPRSTTKREVERHKLKAMTDVQVWDAEQALSGRGYRSSSGTSAGRKS